MRELKLYIVINFHSKLSAFNCILMHICEQNRVCVCVCCSYIHTHYNLFFFLNDYYLTHIHIIIIEIKNSNAHRKQNLHIIKRIIKKLNSKFKLKKVAKDRERFIK